MGFTGITIINGQESEFKDCVKLDQGISFGIGVFETIAIEGKTPVFLHQHCQRMEKGLAALGIDNSIDERLIIDYIDRYSIADCAMKIIATQENIIVSTRENIYSDSLFEEGLTVGISLLKRNPYSHVVYHKSINYADNILEKEIAKKAGFDEVIFTNVHNYLAEGSVSNLFFVSENRLLTPAVSCGILDGIVRKWVINNFVAEEGEFTLKQLMGAEEVFISNSLMGIMPVRKIQDLEFKRPFRISNEIRKAYREEMLRQANIFYGSGSF